MPDKFVVPYGFGDYKATFSGPVIGMLALDRVAVIQAVVDAWGPLGFTLNNMEIRSTGNPAEQGIGFTLPERGVSLFITALELRFHKEQVHWSDMPEMKQMIEKSRDAVLQNTRAKIAAQNVLIALHLQLETRMSNELLASLVSPSLVQLDDAGKPPAHSVMLKWTHKGLLLDISANYANGIFMRLNHDFDGEASTGEIFQRLWEEQLRVYKLLDIEEATNV